MFGCCREAALQAIQEARSRLHQALASTQVVPLAVQQSQQNAVGTLMERLMQAAALAGWRRANFASRSLADRAAAAHAMHLLAAHNLLDAISEQAALQGDKPADRHEFMVSHDNLCSALPCHVLPRRFPRDEVVGD